MLLRLVTLALLTTSIAARPAAPSLAVPLALDEPAGIARHAWPASASVPLPRGRLRAPDGVWLAAPDGATAATQTSVLERWPDGSIRWLLVDFLADVERGGHATYTLRDGKAPRPPSAARVRLERMRDGGVVVDTGALRVTIPATGAALFADIAAGEARLAGPVALPRAAVRDVRDGRPARERPAAETDGRVRAEIVVRGRDPGDLAWEVRVAAFAGERFLRLRHTVTNLGDPLYAPIDALVLGVPVHAKTASFGVDGGARTIAPLDADHELVHVDATPALLDGKAGGRHADGWVRAAGASAVTLVAPDLWREYPKALRAGPEGVAIDLFAGRDAPVRLGTGAAKTHEVWLAVEPPETASSPGELADALGAPLVALPPASWIVASGALPQALSPDAPGARDFLSRLGDAYERYLGRVRTERWDDGPPVPCNARTSEHPRVGLYGVFNWGDWQFPGYRDRTRGCDGWGNLEYDLPQVLALAWTATGSRVYRDGLLAAGRHYRDVDVIHHAPGHPEWVGMNHPHKALHFAFESPEKIDLGHTWTEGLVSLYRLTGETRALETARGIGDALVRRTAAGHVAGARNPRQFGWPMLALVAVHGATGDRRYLDAARVFAADGMEAFRATPASGDWKMGILADGVAAVHAAAPDDRLRRWLIAYADALVASPGRWPDPRYALPLGYLAALTGDARYERTALAVVRDMKIGEWGKPLAAAGRTGFRLLAPLGARAGLRRSSADAGGSPGVTPGRDVPRRGSGRGPRSR